MRSGVSENLTATAHVFTSPAARHTNAIAWVRSMRGGTQAQLVHASDGASYVVKSPRNPQGRRVLINEWITDGILQYLGLRGAPLRAIRVTQAFLDASPQMVLRTGNKVIPWLPCLALGSQYPGQAGTTAVYDYLPSSLMGSVVNLGEFRGMLVVDKWLATQDYRQAVFCRDRIGRWIDSPDGHRHSKRLIAHFVDHGMALGGQRWEFRDAPLIGACQDSSVYRHVREISDFEPYLDRVARFPAEVLTAIAESVPEEWLEAGEKDALKRLCDQLLARRECVATLIDETRIATPSMFPSWT